MMGRFFLRAVALWATVAACAPASFQEARLAQERGD